MKKLLPLAILGALLAPAGSAMALEEGCPRAVLVEGCDAGLITFFSVSRARVAGFQCLYQAEWLSPFVPGASVACNVLEKQNQSNIGCYNNRHLDFSTTLRNDVWCEGYDDAAVPRFITDLWLGESALGIHGSACMDGLLLPLGIDIAPAH